MAFCRRDRGIVSQWRDKCRKGKCNLTYGRVRAGLWLTFLMNHRELDSGVHVGWRERQELSRHGAKGKRGRRNGSKRNEECEGKGEDSRQRLERGGSGLKNEEWE